MQNDEISNLVVFVHLQLVVLIGIARIKGPVGKNGCQLSYAALNHVNGGRFEGFEEAAGQTERDTILVPEFLAPAGGESQEARLCRGFAVQIRQQRCRRLIVTDEAAAVDIAIADPVLQWNAPLPACLARRRSGEGCQRAGTLARYSHRSIAGQPVRPVLVSGLERLSDQQPAKAGTIDEQIRLELLAVIQVHSAYEPILAAQLDVHDLALQSHHAARLRVLAQILRIQARVEMEGICKNRRQRVIALAEGADPAQTRGHGIEGEFLEAATFAHLPKL